MFTRGSRPAFLLTGCALVCLVGSINSQISNSESQVNAAQTELDAGVQHYKAGRLADAIVHFEKAVTLDPSAVKAHLYLATAYATEFVPGVDTPENNHIAEVAIEHYEKASLLTSDTKTKIQALRGLAMIHFNLKKFSDAKKYYLSLIDLDPNDAGTYYSIAVIDWSTAYQPRLELKNKLGLRYDEAISDSKACEQLRGVTLSAIEEGMDMLAKAIELRPDYDDAMAYLNLMWREKADVECGNPEQRKTDIRTADVWVDRALRLKQHKQPRPGSSIVEPPHE